MKIVGLTGGIGSGKSTVAQFFLEKGIPVYNSDWEAKILINENPALIQELTELFGTEAYINGHYNSRFVASRVFRDKELLQKLNEIVHPAVFAHFRQWLDQQNALFVVKEAAILLESGSYKDCDIIISVIADEEIKIKRVTDRDDVSAEQVRDRIQNQLDDDQRIRLSDFVISNNAGLHQLHLEFEEVYKELLSRFQSS